MKFGKLALFVCFSMVVTPAFAQHDGPSARTSVSGAQERLSQNAEQAAAHLRTQPDSRLPEALSRALVESMNAEALTFTSPGVSIYVETYESEGSRSTSIDNKPKDYRSNLLPSFEGGRRQGSAVVFVPLSGSEAGYLCLEVTGTGGRYSPPMITNIQSVKVVEHFSDGLREAIVRTQFSTAPGNTSRGTFALEGVLMISGGGGRRFMVSGSNLGSFSGEKQAYRLSFDKQHSPNSAQDFYWQVPSWEAALRRGWAWLSEAATESSGWHIGRKPLDPTFTKVLQDMTRSADPDPFSMVRERQTRERFIRDLVRVRDWIKYTANEKSGRAIGAIGQMIQRIDPQGTFRLAFHVVSPQELASLEGNGSDRFKQGDPRNAAMHNQVNSSELPDVTLGFAQNGLREFRNQALEQLKLLFESHGVPLGVSSDRFGFEAEPIVKRLESKFARETPGSEVDGETKKEAKLDWHHVFGDYSAAEKKRGVSISSVGGASRYHHFTDVDVTMSAAWDLAVGIEHAETLMSRNELVTSMTEFVNTGRVPEPTSAMGKNERAILARMQEGVISREAAGEILSERARYFQGKKGPAVKSPVARRVADSDVFDSTEDREATQVSKRVGEVLSEEDRRIEKEALAKMTDRQRTEYYRVREVRQSVKDAIREATKR